MKILYLVSDTEFGGGQQYFLSIIEALRDKDFQYTVGGKANTNLEKEVRKRSLDFIPYAVHGKFDIKGMMQFSKELKGKEYDVIFLGDGSAWNTGFFLNKSAGFKNLIPIVHMTHIGLEEKEEYGFIERKLSALWDRTWSRYARKIVVSNRKNAGILISEGVKKDKIRVINNCIDVERIKNCARAPKGEILGKFNIKGDKTIIGTISRLGPGKNVKTLLDAFPIVLERFNNCHFFIVGAGPFQTELEKYIKECGLEKHVTFTGWVENQYDYLNFFDIFLFSGISDGIPYVILEAMAYGKPIAATNNGAVNEAISDGETGVLVEKANNESMAQGIIRLLENKELLNSLKVRAEEYCRNNFNIDRMKREVLKLFEELQN
ncbi:hypothetical protein AMJ80_09370 [bacterium SM23_31]|nr:MAG: hypothetical protein AMJ80_09370 [bacterium SM23_31]